jgi:hypothetical protein
MRLFAASLFVFCFCACHSTEARAESFYPASYCHAFDRGFVGAPAFAKAIRADAGKAKCLPWVLGGQPVSWRLAVATSIERRGIIPLLGAKDFRIRTGLSPPASFLS